MLDPGSREGGVVIESKKSSFCSFGNCVRVIRDGNVIHVGHAGGGEQLTFTAEEWKAFIQGARAGEFGFGMLS
jgi:hypothetical protein